MEYIGRINAVASAANDTTTILNKYTEVAESHSVSVRVWLISITFVVVVIIVGTLIGYWVVEKNLRENGNDGGGDDNGDENRREKRSEKAVVLNNDRYDTERPLEFVLAFAADAFGYDWRDFHYQDRIAFKFSAYVLQLNRERAHLSCADRCDCERFSIFENNKHLVPVAESYVCNFKSAATASAFASQSEPSDGKPFRVVIVSFFQKPLKRTRFVGRCFHDDQDATNAQRAASWLVACVWKTLAVSKLDPLIDDIRVYANFNLTNVRAILKLDKRITYVGSTPDGLNNCVCSACLESNDLDFLVVSEEARRKRDALVARTLFYPSAPSASDVAKIRK